jgi:sugar lactone lactonase YvrE
MKIGKKHKILLLIAIIVLGSAAIIYLTANNTTLSSPESIAYDAASGRFLISNVGNGTIASMDSLGNLDTFINEGLGNPRGIKLVSGTLYVTDNTHLKGFDVKTKKLTFDLPLPNAKMLNDVETDANGNLYVSDTKASILFIVNPDTKKAEPITSPLMTAPNGILYDHPRKQLLIVCLIERSPILSFNIPDRSVSVFKDTMYSNLDGIASDDLGRIYFSSWKEKTIYRIPQEQNRFEIFHKDIDSPADIYYHQATGEIIVPVFEKNQIERIRIE